DPPARLEPGSGTNLAALTTGAYVPPDTRREPRAASASLPPPPPPAEGGKELWKDKESAAAAPGKGAVLHDPQPAPGGGTPALPGTGRPATAVRPAGARKFRAPEGGADGEPGASRRGRTTCRQTVSLFREVAAGVAVA